MTLQQHSPGQPELPAPATQNRAELVVQVPDEEPHSDGAQSAGDHLPHRREDLRVATVATGLFLVVDGKLAMPAQRRSFRRPQRRLHGVHAPDDDGGGQNGKHDLVEDRVAEVVVVGRDEDGEGDGEDGEQDAAARAASVGVDAVEHDAGGVDHGELVDELHWVCALVREDSIFRGDGRLHFSVEWKQTLPRPMHR